jgi:tetratricopeptide (TPR) repeat protein
MKFILLFYCFFLCSCSFQRLYAVPTLTAESKAWSYYYYGIELEQNTQWKEALESFITAAKYDPYGLRIHLHIAICALELQEYSLVKKHLARIESLLLEQGKQDTMFYKDLNALYIKWHQQQMHEIK